MNANDQKKEQGMEPAGAAPTVVRTCLVELGPPRPGHFDSFVRACGFGAAQITQVEAGLAAATKRGAPLAAVSMVTCDGVPASPVLLTEGRTLDDIADRLGGFVARVTVDVLHNYGGLRDLGYWCVSAAVTRDFADLLEPAILEHASKRTLLAAEGSQCQVCAVDLTKSEPHRMWPWLEKLTTRGSFARLREAVEAARREKSAWLAILSTDIPTADKRMTVMVEGATAADVAANVIATQREIVAKIGMPPSVAVQFKVAGFSHGYDELSRAFSSAASAFVGGMGGTA